MEVYVRNPLKRLFTAADRLGRSLVALEELKTRTPNFENSEINTDSYVVKTHVTPVGYSVSVTFKDVPLVIQWAIMALVWRKLAKNVRYGRFVYCPASEQGTTARYVAPLR
jgi:hypothetical protein